MRDTGVFQSLEDLAVVVAEGGRESLLSAVDRDGRAAQGPQLPYEAADRDAGSVLGLAADGEGGEHDGQLDTGGMQRQVGASLAERAGVRLATISVLVASMCLGAQLSQVASHPVSGNGRFSTGPWRPTANDLAADPRGLNAVPRAAGCALSTPLTGLCGARAKSARAWNGSWNGAPYNPAPQMPSVQ